MPCRCRQVTHVASCRAALRQTDGYTVAAVECSFTIVELRDEHWRRGCCSFVSLCSQPTTARCSRQRFSLGLPSSVHVTQRFAFGNFACRTYEFASQHMLHDLADTLQKFSLVGQPEAHPLLQPSVAGSSLELDGLAVRGAADIPDPALHLPSA